MLHTLHFSNAAEAHDLVGYRPTVLARLAGELDVRLTARDAWLKIEGSEEAVRRATDFFEFMRQAREGGAWLRAHALFYALDAFKAGRRQELLELCSYRIEVHPSRPAVFPRTFGQMEYLRSIESSDIVFGLGPAGTGKTYLAMAMAVSRLLQDRVGRLILTRPAMEAGEALGFLPGDMHQKVGPYLRPLYDALYDMLRPEDVDRHIERGIIEVAPLAYMRGRTLNHAFVILDEAQNTTREQMLMFLTRLGFDSQCVITGDLSQIDLPDRKQSGLLEACRRLRGVDGIDFKEFDDSDVVRHDLVQKVIQAYRQGRREEEDAKAEERTATG